jgi:hypothetical protein
MSTTRKNRGSPTKGWISPSRRERTRMLSRCGKKCFLGPNKSFPICSRNSCKINNRGLYSAYVRARQYSKKGRLYNTISRKANKMLIRMKIKR